MCFSAAASFVASVGLTGLAIATYGVARKKDKILVAIPVLFGIQQGFEGFQWLALNRGATLPWAGYGFLFFALIAWPVYVPVFVYMLDKKARRHLMAFVGVGTVIALYFAWILATQRLHIQVRSDCISYRLDLPKWYFVSPVYLMAILGSLLVSSRAIFRWFGGAIALMAVVAWWFYKVNFISVWCFFAAVVSSLFFLYVQRRRSLRNRLLHPG
jgi:hypothetical protein